MAGAKGRSGGARPGAGRKSNAEKARLAALAAGLPEGPPDAPAGAAEEPAGAQRVEYDSLSYLRAVLNDPKATAADKMKAAMTLAPYEYQKLEDGGIKPARQRAAAQAGAGKFAPALPPKLRAVK